MVDDSYKHLGEAAYGFFTTFLKETGDGIKDFFLKNKVGFIPPGMDYSEFQKIKNKAVFKQLKSLIGAHSSLSIILIGLYLSGLDSQSKIKIIEDNRQSIYDKQGPLGVSIMNLAKTGFIEGYVKWLSTYNIDKNPSQKELIDIYEKILDDWSERSLFIQGFMNKGQIKSYITHKINSGKETFFMFASGNTIKTTKDTFIELEATYFFVNNNYRYSTSSILGNEKERVWIIEKII